MCEQVAHSLLNAILDEKKPDICKSDLRHFYARLGANFYAIHLLFHYLYGSRDDFHAKMRRLVEVLAASYIRWGDDLRQMDIEQAGVGTRVVRLRMRAVYWRHR